MLQLAVATHTAAATAAPAAAPVLPTLAAATSAAAAGAAARVAGLIAQGYHYRPGRLYRQRPSPGPTSGVHTFASPERPGGGRTPRDPSDATWSGWRPMGP